MEGIFGTMWVDLGPAALFGALGGFGLGLLHEKGLELPRFHKEGKISFIKFGFLADMPIGALAAIIFYALIPQTATHLVAITATAGLSGSAILKGYISGKVVSEQARLVEGYRDATHMSMKGDVEEVHKRMQELE